MILYPLFGYTNAHKMARQRLRLIPRGFRPVVCQSVKPAVAGPGAAGEGGRKGAN
jgi:hypothetical protein